MDLTRSPNCTMVAKEGINRPAERMKEKGEDGAPEPPTPWAVWWDAR